MKLILQDNQKYVLRFDKDEEVVAGIVGFMKEQVISACAFYAIGACGEVELWYYNSFLKDYRKKSFVEEAEILSLTGNGGVKDGEPILHAHGMFGRNDFSTFGGHVAKLVVSATCEVFLIKMEGALTRSLNQELNLNLLQ